MAQLDLDSAEARGEQWWEFPVGERGMIQVRARDVATAQRRALEELQGLGVLPGPDPERAASWRRLCRATA